jgi:hypothetical protein
LAAANAQSVFSDLQAAMFQEDIEDDAPRQLVVPPLAISNMAKSMVLSGYEKADSTLVNGFVGRLYNGFEVYRSNNVLHEVTLTLAGNPTAADTFTIGGVVFTFRAAGTAAVA